MRSASIGRGQRLWPVLILLLVAAIVPMACVLWFMGQAMRNERLAARQRLIEAYQPSLERVREKLAGYWQEQLANLPAFNPEVHAASVFAETIERRNCDSVVLYDTGGTPQYPDARPLAHPEESADSEDWKLAQAMEFKAHDLRFAASLYALIADNAEPPESAIARMAQARCLARNGNKPAGARVLLALLKDPRSFNITDASGRSVMADACVLTMEYLEPAEPAWTEVRDGLVRLLTDYRSSAILSAQRRVLMAQLVPTAGAAAFPTLQAEQLAAEFVESTPPNSSAGRLSRSMLAGVWQLRSVDGTATALFRENRMVADMTRIMSEEAMPHAQLRLVVADTIQDGPAPFLALPISDATPGWQVGLFLLGADPFAAEAERRTITFLWTGLAVTGVILLLTVLVGRYVGRQVKLTRLKNDLIATVSHELKTPLASIRALVDTLLNVDGRDPRQTREYLELVARENLRLSRLIDNFLAFSRMERNKQAFVFARVDPASIVAAACEAAGERFTAPDGCLKVDIRDRLPAIIADRDALVTVLLNLLDNAWKYTQDSKRIGLKAYAVDGRVRFEVNDNGIGLSRRTMRRIFDRFYQVDQTLSRRTGGCGLGLSIVKFIVEAHGGEIEVRSRPGEGSIFTVTIPASSGPGCASEASGS